MDYFLLMRNFWDFCFENPDKIKPQHCALYCFTVEHCNRLGWKHNFGLPTEMAKEAIGIRSYNSYISTLNDLVGFGFIKMIEKSKNQYSSNIVALSYYDKALDKALDKAFIKHDTKQGESIDSIDKPINNKTNKQIHTSFLHFSISISEYEKLYSEYTEEQISEVFGKIENYKKNKNYVSLYLPAKNWLKDYPKKNATTTKPKMVY